MKNEDLYAELPGEVDANEEMLREYHEQQNDLVFSGIKQPFETPCKATINKWADAITEAVSEGFIDPLEMHVRLKAIMSACDIALKATEEAAITQAAKYGKGATYFGNELKISEGRSNYKFDNSPAIINMEAKLKAAKELAKTLAKTNGIAVADTETGEIIEPAKIEYGKATISVTFK